MAGDWTEHMVLDLQNAGHLLVEDGNHGEYRPRRDEFCAIGVAFIRAADMNSGRVLFQSASKIGEIALERIRKGIGAGGDVLLSHKGTVGKVAIAPMDAPPFVCSPQTTFWRSLNQEVIDRRFLYFFLRSDFFQQQLDARKGETDMADYVSLTAQRALGVRFPSIDEQRATAHILGSLDDKIELNRRMNRTLEQMAAAIFKAWFVDFEPVKAKADGAKSFPSMPQKVFDALPTEFTDSPLGPIPKGWKNETLGNLCEKAQYGYTASASTEHVGPKFLRITDINKRPWINWNTVPFCPASDTDFEKYRVMPGDILIARMADPGHGVLIEEEVDAVFASYLIRFRPLVAAHHRYLQYWLRSSKYWALVNGQKSGTTRANLNAKVLSAFPLIVPSVEVAEAFCSISTALRERVVTDVRESNTLAAIRDALLPKLLSGEIRVGEAECIAERAV